MTLSSPSTAYPWWIKDKPFKFLGKQTLANASDTAARKKMEQTINDGVAKIDALPLTGVQKMWIFDAVLMSKPSWDFMVHNTTTTWIATHLGSIQTGWYKKWARCPKDGIVSIFCSTAPPNGCPNGVFLVDFLVILWKSGI